MKSLRHSEDIYRHIAECLSREERAVLATVISLHGSGPREPGAMMLITEDGKTFETIGGGLLEAMVIDRAKKVLRTGRAQVFAFTMSDQRASEGGMICGGRVKILIERLDGADPSVVGIWEKVLKARDEGRCSWLIRSIRDTTAGEDVGTGIGLLDEDRLDSGTLDVLALSVEKLKEQGCKAEPVMMTVSDTRYFVQPTAPAKTVFIFGAGHIAEDLAPFCNLLGFRTVIIDDRRDFANRERFPAADVVYVPHSFLEVFGELDIGPESFIVIVTRGHLHDQNVLSRALRTQAGYIGMIASRRKRDIVYQSLLEEGFSTDDLLRVHSPIGLDIGARTPAEIAVSIAAELIAVRAGMGRRREENNF